MSIDTWINVASAFLTFVGLCFLAYEIHQHTRESAQNHKRSKREATFDTYQQNREDLRRLNECIIAAFGTDQLSDEAVETIWNDRERRQEVTRLLSILERWAIGCKYGIFDRDLLIDLSGSAMARAFRRLSPYITRVRQESETFYENAEELVTLADQVRLVSSSRCPSPDVAAFSATPDEANESESYHGER